MAEDCANQWEKVYICNVMVPMSDKFVFNNLFVLDKQHDYQIKSIDIKGPLMLWRPRYAGFKI